MNQRGVSYHKIWEIIYAFFPHHVLSNVMEGTEDYSILSRVNPFERLNLNHFIRPIIYHLEKEEIYCYERLEENLVSLISELQKCQNWRTESLIKCFHNSLFRKTRKEIDFIQKYIANNHIIYSEDVFELNDYQNYAYIDTPPIDYCDLNMLFLSYFPELISEYKMIVLKYHGDDTDSCTLYSKLLERYLLKDIDDKIKYTKVLDFFKRITELSDIKEEGIWPTGVVFGNGSGVLSYLDRAGIIIPFDFTIDK